MSTEQNLNEHIRELELRIEGMELLLALLLERVEVDPALMPEPARKVFEERYSLSTSTPTKGAADAATR